MHIYIFNITQHKTKEPVKMQFKTLVNKKKKNVKVENEQKTKHT